MWYLFIDLPIAALVIYFVYDFVTSYLAATGTVWQRIIASGKGSLTIVWARFVVLISGASGGLVVLADYLNAPGVSDAIKTMVQPQYVMILLVAIPLITEFARRRTL